MRQLIFTSQPADHSYPNVSDHHNTKWR